MRKNALRLTCIFVDFFGSEFLLFTVDTFNSHWNPDVSIRFYSIVFYALVLHLVYITVQQIRLSSPERESSWIPREREREQFNKFCCSIIDKCIPYIRSSDFQTDSCSMSPISSDCKPSDWLREWCRWN